MRTKSKVVRQEPAADIEEVKRRFIRQNRELAKNNSTQSLRIRSLELDISRLLGENLDLKNQVLHLQHENHSAQVRASSNAARTFKDGMRAKLAELCAIVDGIDEEEVVELPESLRRKRPSGGLYRERQPLTEIMRDSQMPTIAEDKMFPRRTLGADDLRAIRLSDQSSTESPDLGPPPVARLDYEDPVKMVSPLGNKPSPPAAVTTHEDEDLLPVGFAANLETRRKRRDAGQSRVEMRRTSILPQSPAKTEGEQQPVSAILRTGAKRKLADREGDRPIKPPSKGDFTFSRRTATEDIKNSTQNPKAKHEQANEAAAVDPKPSRRVLGDKSVNMSPRKAVSRADKPEKEDAEKSLATNKDTRRRRTSSIPLPSPPRNNILPTIDLPISSLEPPPATTTDDCPAPSTPAALDLFSPTPSIPSTKPEATGRGDTPPPSDLSTLSLATSNGDGDARPSRRARAAVNYAEPSLISKMRRPDKKMVDAISGLRDPKCVMSASSARTVRVKEEVVEGEEGVGWKDLPPAVEGGGEEVVVSPLEGKGAACGGLPGLGLTLNDNDRIHDNDDDVIAVKPSATTLTVSALVAAGNRKRRHSSQHQQAPLGTDIYPDNDRDSDIDTAARKMQELDLYDFKESSSPLTDASSGSTSRALAARSKVYMRRHSTVPRQEGAVDVDVLSDGKEEAGATLRREAGSRVGRRRSMML